VRAVGRQADLQPLVQEHAGVVEPALHDGHGAELGPGARGEPGVLEPLAESAQLAQVAERVVVAPHGGLHEPDGGDRQRRPERLVLRAQVVE
jgi:hypothetical protein